MSVPARRFIARTARLPAYQGAIANRAAAEQQEQQPQQADGGPDLTVEQMNLMVPGLIQTVEV